MSSSKNQHVIPNNNNGWSVRRAGAARASRVFPNQKDAIAYARDMARKEQSELYIHKRDGTIRHKDSYGSDPYPPKDKR